MPFSSHSALDAPSTIDLFEAGDIVDDDVCGIIEAFMAHPRRRIFRFGNGYQIDVAAAVAAHRFAQQVMRQPWAGEDLKRAAVRTAILLAWPTKGK